MAIEIMAITNKKHDMWMNDLLQVKNQQTIDSINLSMRAYLRQNADALLPIFTHFRWAVCVMRFNSLKMPNGKYVAIWSVDTYIGRRAWPSTHTRRTPTTFRNANQIAYTRTIRRFQPLKLIIRNCDGQKGCAFWSYEWKRDGSQNKTKKKKTKNNKNKNSVNFRSLPKNESNNNS